MWLMLQAPRPDDYVIGTGESRSVREFLDAAAARAGLDWKDFVRIDQRYFRPAEVDVLQADASKAARELGWKPGITFEALVQRMVDADMELAAREKRAQG
jgi:GDPmannose 4,6-dehydratase